MALIGFAIVPKKPKEKSEMAAPTRTGRFVHITIKAVNSGKYLSVTAINAAFGARVSVLTARRPASPVLANIGSDVVLSQITRWGAEIAR